MSSFSIEEKVKAFKESFMWVSTTNGTLEQDCTIMTEHFERVLKEQREWFKKLVEENKGESNSYTQANMRVAVGYHNTKLNELLQEIE